MKRTYLFDLGKIIEGSANGDHAKVVAYAEKLAERMEADGDVDAARRLRQVLGKSKRPSQTVGLAKVASSAPLPVDSESRLPTADETRIVAGDVEIFLSPGQQRFVDQFLMFYRAADRLVASGVGISASMLVYGPPGCGKTQLAKYIAAELALPLITARTDTLISSYLGSTAKNIRLLFQHACSRPCVLFLDEFDAIAKMRDDSRELGELKRVVISLLQNIDAMGPEHVLLAATNHEHLLDQAIWRRFNYKLKIAEPDRGIRIRMITRFFGSFASPQLIDVVAALTEGMSGATLRAIAEDCIRSAVLTERSAVTVREAVQGVLSTKPEYHTAEINHLDDHIRAMRLIDPKTFTQTLLADLFDISQSKVCRILKEANHE
jgi:hypothetical protein